jgi:uncharacterized phage protein gp47/JayE
MTYKDGEITVRSQEEWLNLILEEGTDYWGEEITERDNTSIHKLYEPFAGRLHELEQQLQTVLQSLQVSEAEGVELDRIGERYGIYRNPAREATGRVTFSRSTAASKDYVIQSGTTVQTDGNNPLLFYTTETVTLSSGSKQVSADIIASETGTDYNLPQNAIRSSLTVPNGVQEISNRSKITGGRNEESDTEYRRRILNTLSNAESASGWNIYKTLTSKEYVRDVLYVDVKSNISTPNLAEGDYEITVDAKPDNEDKVAQLIFENSPMGSNSVGGNRGTKVSGVATLPNGQRFTMNYSRPTVTDIYVDAVIETTREIDTDDVISSIVNYIGGTKINSETTSGKLRMGDDVIYGNVDYHIRDVPGVKDIDSLKVDTSSSPSGTSSITIGKAEKAETDASDINIQTL